MMNNFKGYLLMFGSNESGARRLQHYLAQNPTLIPYQRTEAEAYRDANNDLHRVTINNHKSKIEFSTISNINLEEKQEIENIMQAGLIDEVQRKYRVTYWNDDVNEYRNGDFYIPDTSYKIIKVDTERKTLIYDSVSYTLIEY